MDRYRAYTVLLIAATLAAAPGVRAECRMIKVATLPVRMLGNQPLVPGKVNGRDMNIFADTGARDSVLWRKAAQQAGVNVVTDPRYRMQGFSGETDVYRGTVAELQIGDFTIRDRSWPAIDGSFFGDEVGMILGFDFWSKMDVEFNLAGSEIVLWEPEGCKGAALGYWNKDFLLAKLETPLRGSFQTYVMLNGVRVKALIDSGSESTLINSVTARRIGFRTSEQDTGASGEVSGIGGNASISSFVATFDTFEMGDLTIKNARIIAFEFERHTRETRVGTRIAESPIDPGDMIIGADFLLANRVLVSPSQGLIYMTYNGGKVFQTQAPLTMADLPPEAQMLSAFHTPGAEKPEDLPGRSGKLIGQAMKFISSDSPAEAEPPLREALAELDQHGASESLEFTVLSMLTGSLDAQDKLAEQEPVYLRMLPLADKVLGPDEPGQVMLLLRYGVVLDRQQKHGEAERVFRDALELSEKINGPEHTTTADVLVNVGLAVESQERFRDAESLYERAAAIYRDQLGEDAKPTVRAVTLLEELRAAHPH